MLIINDRVQYNRTIAIDNQKLEALNIALMKICRETGEDENEDIIFLREDCEIEITNVSYGIPNPNYLLVWVEEPFSKDLLLQIKRDLTSFLVNYKSYIKIIGKNGMKYINHPLIIRVNEVDVDIFDVLKNEHNISSSYLKCYEWEEIQNSDIWKRARIQVAKEIIARKIYDDIFKISYCLNF